MKEIINLIQEVERLKFIPRLGWTYYGIKFPESVAEHSFLVVFLSLIVGLLLLKRGENVDLKKILIMAIIHELGEARIGDIHLVAKKYLGFDNVNNAEKKVVFDLLNGLNLEELKEIYEEFMEGKSREAIIVRACDKLELLIQAKIYKLEEFFKNNENLSEIEKEEIIKEIFTYLYKNP
ncbi:MAG: HD domain-containing protein [Candidatus Hydrothermia bacterium]|jgi:putative hydrolase of HD superfamily